MERVNARYLMPSMFDARIVCQRRRIVHIIKADIATLMRVLASPYIIVTLIKPQFEAAASAWAKGRGAR